MDEFIDVCFANILELREVNRRLLEVMYVRQREQAPVVKGIGDIFLDAATEFRMVYPTYVGNLPNAEKRMKDEVEHNPEFKRFLEVRRPTLCVCRCGGSDRPNIFNAAMCEAPRRTPSRPQALPEQTVGAPAEISADAGGDLQGDD